MNNQGDSSKQEFIFSGKSFRTGTGRDNSYIPEIEIVFHNHTLRQFHFNFLNCF